MKEVYRGYLERRLRVLRAALQKEKLVVWSTSLIFKNFHTGEIPLQYANVLLKARQKEAILEGKISSLEIKLNSTSDAQKPR